MIPVSEAHGLVSRLGQPLETEVVPLHKALGRVLAEPATARLTQPPFPASAMDGYAIAGEDKVEGRTLEVTGEIAAGGDASTVVKPGTAVRIFTGAQVPAGATTVVIQEDTIREGDTITLRAGMDEKSHVRPAGGDFLEGSQVAAPRTLSPADIGLLAAMNVERVRVHRQAKVAIIPTGDELVAVGENPGPGQIIASSAHAVAALFSRTGADAQIFPIAPDRPDALYKALERTLEMDLVVTLGGASVGDHDLVQDTAKDLGLDLSFYKIRMRPGKPLICGTLQGARFLGLPGNPVSSMVCARIFGVPLVRSLHGLPYTPPRPMVGTLAHPIGQNGNREHYMRASARFEENWVLNVFERQDSSLMSVLSQANALVIREPGAPALEAQARVKFILVDELLTAA